MTDEKWYEILLTTVRGKDGWLIHHYWNISRQEIFVYKSVDIGLQYYCSFNEWQDNWSSLLSWTDEEFFLLKLKCYGMKPDLHANLVKTLGNLRR